jgi:hypothetical protein
MFVVGRRLWWRARGEILCACLGFLVREARKFEVGAAFEVVVWDVWVCLANVHYVVRLKRLHPLA